MPQKGIFLAIVNHQIVYPSAIEDVLHRGYWQKSTHCKLDLLPEESIQIHKGAVSLVVEHSRDAEVARDYSVADIHSVLVDADHLGRQR